MRSQVVLRPAGCVADLGNERDAVLDPPPRQVHLVRRADPNQRDGLDVASLGRRNARPAAQLVGRLAVRPPRGDAAKARGHELPSRIVTLAGLVQAERALRIAAGGRCERKSRNGGDDEAAHDLSPMEGAAYRHHAHKRKLPRRVAASLDD